MNYSETAHNIGRQFYAQAVAFAPKALSGILIFIAFWIGGLVIRAIIIRAANRTRIAPDLVRLLSRTAQTIWMIFGSITALGTIGVNVGALIAGLGLSSFALGFAFKDALSNFLAGILILLYKPFKVGDRITMTGLEGTVVEIDMRYTQLETAEKRILIPNSSIFVNPILIAHGQKPIQQPV
jgi:small conductance mechanosensitive channel